MRQVIFLVLLGFFTGSVPFSVIACRIFLKTDVRQYGDGNPGGTNAWKAGGWSIGTLVVILDMFKGYLPVMLARRAGLSGWELVPVALAPILGHAFSPFLKFHGGKALGTTGGVWIALIGFKALAIYLLLTLPVLALQGEDALASNSGLLSLLGYTVWIENSPWLITFALFSACLVAWKHRKELVRPFRLRPWVTNMLTRRNA
jgi:glycerol-3-phosphate acyltransferase PlsY